MAIPKQQNGMGFRDIRAIIVAFSCKLWWKKQKNDTTWSTYLWSLPSTYKSSSHTWKRICSVTEFANTQSKILVGKGTSPFWDANWLGTGAMVYQCSSAPTPFPDLTIAEFFQDKAYYLPFLETILATSSLLLLQELNLNNQHEDRLIWSTSTNGQFTVKNAYRSLKAIGDDVTIHQVWNFAFLSGSYTIGFYHLVTS